MPLLRPFLATATALALLAPAPAFAAATADSAATEAAEPAFDMATFASRATHLQLHQAFGLATLASMAVTAGLGYWRVDQGGASGVLDAHLLMAGATTALYLTTGTLELTAGPKQGAQDDNPFSSIALHKDLAWFHIATMASTVGLGLATNYLSANYRDYHAIAAYTTLSLMALSAGVIAFGE